MKIKPLNILFNILAIVTVAAVGFVAFNVFSGAKAYAVVTDSMSPQIKKGSVVFVRQVDFEKLHENDIVTVEFPDGDGCFTHRIISIDYDAGIFRTKGDANEKEDPQPSMKEQIIGRLWYAVPALGYISIFIKSMNLIKISVISAVAAIVVFTAAAVVQKSRKYELVVIAINHLRLVKPCGSR